LTLFIVRRKNLEQEDGRARNNLFPKSTSCPYLESGLCIKYHERLKGRHSSKRSDPGILLRSHRKDSGQAGMTNKRQNIDFMDRLYLTAKI